MPKNAGSLATIETNGIVSERVNVVSTVGVQTNVIGIVFIQTYSSSYVYVRSSHVCVCMFECACMHVCEIVCGVRVGERDIYVIFSSFPFGIISPNNVSFMFGYRFKDPTCNLLVVHKHISRSRVSLSELIL